MEYATLVNSSVDSLIHILRNEITLHDIAVSYILLYVAYKGLSRYLYFRADEHSSKIKRTFLALSLLIVFISYGLSVASIFSEEENLQWFIALCLFGLAISPASILFGKLIYEFDYDGSFNARRTTEVIPITKDYTKTVKYRKDNDGDYYEEEVVKSTYKNIHSDVTLNFFAGVYGFQYFILLIIDIYKNSGMALAIATSLLATFMLAIYVDRAIFTWVKLLNSKYKTYIFEKKNKKILTRATITVFIFFVLINLYIYFYG